MTAQICKFRHNSDAHRLTLPVKTATLPYTLLAPGVAIGEPLPSHWRALVDCPLLIFAGVTGVGKSTTLALLQEMFPDMTLLPDRRDLTDRLIISWMQTQDGLPVEPVRDRRLRFDYTRRYREQFSGGMAHALTQLRIAPDASDRLVFDGLRGENEVTYAAQALPHARFVILDAPDLVRVQRLVTRNDAFDQVASSGTSEHALDLPEGAETIFSTSDLETMASWVKSGAVAATDLRAKIEIVLEERRNYDPAATIAALQRTAPAATLVVDTVTHTPTEVAQQIAAWWSAVTPAGAIPT
jgi:hypothetical protein